LKKVLTLRGEQFLRPGDDESEARHPLQTLVGRTDEEVDVAEVEADGPEAAHCVHNKNGLWLKTFHQTAQSGRRIYHPRRGLAVHNAHHRVLDPFLIKKWKIKWIN